MTAAAQLSLPSGPSGRMLVMVPPKNGMATDRLHSASNRSAFRKSRMSSGAHAGLS